MSDTEKRHCRVCLAWLERHSAAELRECEIKADERDMRAKLNQMSDDERKRLETKLAVRRL